MIIETNIPGETTFLALYKLQVCHGAVNTLTGI